MRVSHILSVLIAHCCLKKEQIEVNGANSPNIVLIFADDVGQGEVPGYWNTGKVNMPNLQSLVNAGTVFTDVHSTPLCAPSRYVLLSGNYQHRGHLYGGTWQVNYKSGQFRDGQQSIAQVLQTKNYHTAMTGKWHLGGKVPTKAGVSAGGNGFFVSSADLLTNDRLDWSKPLEKGSPVDMGFDSSLMSFGGIQGGPYKFFRDGKFENLSDIKVWKEGEHSMPEGISMIRKESEGSSDWDSTAFNMIQVNETARFLDDHIQNRPNDPFFTYIALGTVHTPHSPPTVYLDGSPVAGQYDTSHMDVLGEMDKVVGSIVQHLEDRNLLGDTIVIFTSDNGGLGPKYTEGTGHNGSGQLRGAKGQIYEGGHRVPLIMRWDNGPIPAGQTRSHLIGLNDLFATISELAGANVPEGQAIDSVSFADYIENPGNTANLRTYLGVWAVKNGKLNEESIRKNNLKLIRSRISGYKYLYDLDKDISETTNLINEAIYKDTVSEMMDKLKEISPCYDNEGTFIVSGQSQPVTCAWFRQQSQRCQTYYEGQIECRLACAGRSRGVCGSISVTSPTSEPASSPVQNPTSSNGCVDSTDRFSVGGGKKQSCAWVARKFTQDRCKISGVSSKCPKTCSDNCENKPTSEPASSPVQNPTSSNGCVDSTDRFSVGGGKKQSCAWVARKFTQNRCKISGISSKCPKTCNDNCDFNL